MHETISILEKLLPFIITLFLWRMSIYFWNPAGILALIPIFYYTFVRPIRSFTCFGLVFCFLIDYRCNLPLFWTCLYCLFYAINGFQNFLDMEHTDNNALYIFLSFIGIGFLLLIFSGLTWTNLVNNVWLFIWMGVLYTPIITIDNWAKS
mgnify:CR=1 FL=1